MTAQICPNWDYRKGGGPSGVPSRLCNHSSARQRGTANSTTTSCQPGAEVCALFWGQGSESIYSVTSPFTPLAPQQLGLNLGTQKDTFPKKRERRQERRKKGRTREKGIRCRPTSRCSMVPESKHDFIPVIVKSVQ